MLVKSVLVLFLIWSKCAFAVNGVKERTKNSSNEEDSHLAFEGPRRAIAVPFWKKDNADVVLKVVSESKLPKNQYTPSLYEIRSAGLWELEKTVQYCQDLSRVYKEGDAGQIKLQFQKKSEKKYELVGVVADPQMEKLGKCIDDQFNFREKLDKEIQKRNEQ